MDNPREGCEIMHALLSKLRFDDDGNRLDSDNDIDTDLQNLRQERRATKVRQVKIKRNEEYIITREVLHRVLSQDFFSRKSKNWPLIPFDDHLAEMRTKVFKYDNDVFGVPNRRKLTKHYRTDEFRIKLKENAIVVQQILEKYQGKLYLCGGAVCGITKKHSTIDDYDMFFVNVTTAEAEFIIKDCIDIIQGYEEDDSNYYTRGEEYHKILRNEHATTVYQCELKIQFIHRIYERIDLVLGGFDIPYCAIAWDGTQILMTYAAYFSHGTGTIIVDIGRRSTTYEKRLVKYCHKYGLGVILPGTSLEKIKEAEPKAHFYHSGVVFPFLTLYINFAGYGEYRYSFIKRTIQSNNTCLLQTRVGKKILYVEPKDYDLTEAYDHCWRKINRNAILQGNLSFVSCLGRNDDLLSHEIPVCDFDAAELKQYIKKWPYNNVLRMFGQKLTDKILEDLSTGYFEEEIDGYLIAISMRLQAGLEKVKQERKQFGWITSNPGRQWTSSFNPVITNPTEWYGKFYKNFEVGIPWNIVRTLALSRLPKSESTLLIFSRDVFNLIMRTLIKMYFEDYSRTTLLRDDLEDIPQVSILVPADIPKIIEQDMDEDFQAEMKMIHDIIKRKPGVASKLVSLLSNVTSDE